MAEPQLFKWIETLAKSGLGVSKQTGPLFFFLWHIHIFIFLRKFNAMLCIVVLYFFWPISTWAKTDFSGFVLASQDC